MLHYDYTDPEGNKVRGKVEGLLGSTNTTQSVSASPKKSSSNDNHKTGQAVNPGNSPSSAGGDTSTSDSASSSTLPPKDGNGSANSELIVTSGWFIDPEISTGPLAIHQSPSLLSAPEFREAVSLGIQELQVGPGFFALPNWDSLYGANQDYDLARAKEMIAEIQVSLDSGFWPDSIDSMKVCVEALSGEMVQHEGTISDSLKNLGINIASPGSQDCDRIFLISVAPSTIPVEAPDVTDSSICGDIEGLTGKLMFDGRSNRTAIHELYQLDLDGCKVQVLQVPEGAGPFSYSPMRGSFVVTKPHSNIINNSDIWSFGGHSLQEKANLTNNGDHQFQSHSPDWSPDGNQIAYTQNNGVSASIIMVMNFDGTGKRRLEPFAGFPGAYDSGPGIDREGAPVWSPDGSKIAFVSSSSYLLPVNNEIYVVNSDGSDLIQLTKNGTANDLAPQWSPDGKKIVYQSDDDGSGRQGESNIWIVDAEGTGQPMVTIRLEGSETYPIWSPDGNKIAFKSNSNRNDGNNDIWVMDVDGSDVSRVTFTEEPFYLSESLRWIE